MGISIPMAETVSAADRARILRAHALHAVTASLVRTGAVVAVLTAFALHNHFILGALNLRHFTLLTVGGIVYCAIAWLVLHRVYCRPRPRDAFDFRNFFQSVDAIGCVIAVYLSGGERSWLFVFIAMVVMNQSHASPMRALVTGHISVVAYTAALVLAGVTAPAAAVTKVVLLYMVVWIGVGVGMIARRDQEELARKLRKAKSIAEKLQAAGRAASESLELPDVLARVLEQLRQVIDYDGASIQLLEGEALRVIAVRGLPESELGHIRPLSDFPYNRLLMESRDPVILELPAPGIWFPVPGREELRTVMGVPLIVRDKTIGAMSIDSLVRHAFGAAEIDVARAFAAQAAIAIDNARLYEATREQSWRDGLTGVANRRRFDEVLEAERSRAALAVIMMDIDHFKLFNDRYGHAAGDDVLRTVACALQQGVDGGGLFARYGGEEFVALLPSTSIETAYEYAGRLRSRIEGLSIPHDQSPHGIVTLSLGVGRSVEEADAALYDAKRAGRNRAA